MDTTSAEPQLVKVEIVEKKRESKARGRDLAQLVVSFLLGIVICLWVSFQTPSAFATPTAYFTGLAGCGVFFAAFAAAARALELVWPGAGFKVSERVMIAVGAFWTAGIALTQITVFGIGS